MKKQELKELISARNSLSAKIRWAKTTKEQRKKYITKMNNARLAKMRNKKLSTV